MKKPIVLKQRLRWDWIRVVLLALLAGFWSWHYLNEPTAALINLPGLILISASPFFARVTLDSHQITVQNSLIDTRKHRFIRILRYLVKPQGKQLNVELTVEQMWPQKSELFGIEFSFKRGKPASIQERNFSFYVELEQAETLMNYLHAQGASEDVFAEMEWRKLQILLASAREIRRLEKEQGELSDEEERRFLAEFEAKLSKVEDEL